MFEICGSDELQLDYTDKLKRKVQIIAKALILLHTIVSIILLLCFKYIFIAWIPFIIPIILLYYGARKKKTGYLMPFIVVMTLIQAIVICPTSILRFLEFLNRIFDMKAEEIAIFLLELSTLGIANILTIWVIKTTDRFRTELCIEALFGLTFEEFELNTTQPRSISSASVDIVRCESCGIDFNPFDSSVINQSNRGNQIIEVNDLQQRVNLIEDSSSINEDSNEPMQDLPLHTRT